MINLENLVSKITRENTLMKRALLKLGITENEISDICDGAI